MQEFEVKSTTRILYAAGKLVTKFIGFISMMDKRWQNKTSGLPKLSKIDRSPCVVNNNTKKYLNKNKMPIFGTMKILLGWMSVVRLKMYYLVPPGMS